MEDTYFELRSYDAAESSSKPIESLKWAFWTPGETRDVFVSVFIDRISNIDTKLHQLTVSFTLYMKWKPSKQEFKEYSDSVSGKAATPFSPTWFPRFYVENACSVLSHGPHPRERTGGWHVIKNKGLDVFGHRVSLPTEMPCLFARCEHMSVVLSANYDLDNFPFDVQDIPLVVMSGLPRGEVRMCPNEWNPEVGCVEILTSLSPLENSWQLHAPVVEFGAAVGELHEVNTYSDSVTIRLKISRRSSLFVYRIGLVALLLSAGVFAVFAVAEDLYSRLSDLLLLLLATTVFQSLWASSLPATHAITIAEHYMRFTVLFIFLALGETALVRILDGLKAPGKAINDTDLVLRWVLFAVWIVVHVVFGSYCVKASVSERSKITATKQQMQKLWQPHVSKVLSVTAKDAKIVRPSRPSENKK